MAKRKEIAASIREDSANLKDASNPVPQMLRLMESLEYEKDPATLQQVEQMAGTYVGGLKKLPAAKLAAKKGEATHVASAFKFLAKFKILPDTFGPKVELDQIVQEQRWEKKGG
jgi:hypothetical protein